MPADDDDDEEDDEEEAVDMEGKKKITSRYKEQLYIDVENINYNGFKMGICLHQCICYLHGQSFVHKIKKRKLNS